MCAPPRIYLEEQGRNGKPKWRDCNKRGATSQALGGVVAMGWLGAPEEADRVGEND